MRFKGGYISLNAANLSQRTAFVRCDNSCQKRSPYDESHDPVPLGGSVGLLYVGVLAP